MFFLLYLSYFLIISSFLFVMGSIIHGQFIFFIFDSNYIFFNHIAFFSSMLYSVTQSFVLFYIVGLSRAIANISNIPQDYLETLSKNKSKNYSHTMLNIMIIGLAYIIAVAVDNDFLNPYIYILIANIGLIHYTFMISWQHKALKDCIVFLKFLDK